MAANACSSSTTPDPIRVRSQLYRHIARAYLPTPSPNFVRVVINGETWGIYVNTQPLDETFTREHFNSPSGDRRLADAAFHVEE